MNQKTGRFPMLAPGELDADQRKLVEEAVSELDFAALSGDSKA